MAEKSSAIELHPDISVMSDEEALALNAELKRRTLEAATVEELFQRPGTIGLPDIEGMDVTVNSVRFLESSEEYRASGYGFYCVMDTDHGAVSTGAASVVEKLFVANRKGFLPLTLRFTKASKKTRAGYTVWDVSLVSQS